MNLRHFLSRYTILLILLVYYIELGKNTIINEINEQLADIDKLFPLVMKWEGGYVDDPDDSGGRTKYGVTERTWWLYGGRKDIADITQDDAKRVMKKLFWDKCKRNRFVLHAVAKVKL